MEKKNTSILIAKIVVLLLCILYVISAVWKFINAQDVRPILGIIVTVLNVYYMFVGYKKPHGNLLRYVFIIATLEAILIFWITFTKLQKLFGIYELFLLLEIAIISYVAGRLNKFKQNIVLLSVAFIMAVIVAIYSFSLRNLTSVIAKISQFNVPIIILGLIVSYIARYKEHKEAGLED